MNKKYRTCNIIIIPYPSFTQIFCVKAIFGIRLQFGRLLHLHRASRTGDAQQFGVEETERCDNALVAHLERVRHLGSWWLTNQEWFFLRTTCVEIHMAKFFFELLQQHGVLRLLAVNLFVRECALLQQPVKGLRHIRSTILQSNLYIYIYRNW